MSIFDRYRSTTDDALDLARRKAEASRRRRVVPQAPGTAAPKDPAAPKVAPGDPRSGGALQPQPGPGGRLPANPGKGFMGLVGEDVSVGPKALPGGSSADEDLDDLARTRAEREKERKAAEEELRLGKQRAVQQADARAGLAGFGLSGATSAQVSNVARAQDRTATLALADLDRRQRDEDFQAIQRKAALADLEDALGEDLDGDGSIAGKTPDDRDLQQDIENVVAAKDLPKLVATRKEAAEEVTAAEFKALGGPGALPEDEWVYAVTNEDPPRFVKVRASALGVKT